jgi:hypothetical protein
MLAIIGHVLAWVLFSAIALLPLRGFWGAILIIAGSGTKVSEIYHETDRATIVLAWAYVVAWVIFGAVLQARLMLSLILRKPI